VGYTHYWYRRRVYPRQKMRAIVDDFAKVVAELEAWGVVIKGPDGTGEPILTGEEVAFNGDANCGHPRRELGIPWPDDDAFGVGRAATVSGQWFAGALLKRRTCNGDCSHETFYFPRVMLRDHHTALDYHFDSCKTAFKPYDLAVQAFLIVAKHHLGDEILISSDGDEQHWIDAQNLVDHTLGYGMDFDLLAEKEKVNGLHGTRDSRHTEVDPELYLRARRETFARRQTTLAWWTRPPSGDGTRRTRKTERR